MAVRYSTLEESDRAGRNMKSFNSNDLFDKGDSATSIGGCRERNCSMTANASAEYQRDPPEAGSGLSIPEPAQSI